MKKQNKKSKIPLWRRMFATPRRTVISLATMFSLLLLAAFVYGLASSFWFQYSMVSRQASMAPIRASILRNIDNNGTAAPVEAKTGDVYFPPLRLMLPAKFTESYGPSTFRYSWDAAEKRLSVTDMALVNREANKLLNATDFDDMFRNVPGLQACSRGVIFMPSGEALEGWDMRGSIQPAGSPRWDLYTDKACPQNSSVTAALLGLKAY